MAITIINLARSQALPKLLPFAFYLACQLPVETILQGAKHRDGTIEQLSSVDIVRCLKGREELAKINVLLLQKLKSHIPGQNECQKRKCTRKKTTLAIGGDVAFSPDLMGYRFKDWEEGFCGRCTKGYQDIVEDVRQRIFPMLQDIFDVRGYENCEFFE